MKKLLIILLLIASFLMPYELQAQKPKHHHKVLKHRLADNRPRHCKPKKYKPSKNRKVYIGPEDFNLVPRKTPRFRN